MREPLFIGDACRILDRHPNTVRRYVAQGLIHAARDRNGYRRFSLKEVLRLKEILERRDPEIVSAQVC